MGERDTGVGWVVEKAKTKKQDDTNVEFRVAMTCKCAHKGSVIIKFTEMWTNSGSHIRSPLPNWSCTHTHTHT